MKSEVLFGTPNSCLGWYTGKVLWFGFVDQRGVKWNISACDKCLGSQHSLCCLKIMNLQ